MTFKQREQKNMETIAKCNSTQQKMTKRPTNLWKNCVEERMKETKVMVLMKSMNIY